MSSSIIIFFSFFKWDLLDCLPDVTEVYVTMWTLHLSHFHICWRSFCAEREYMFAQVCVCVCACVRVYMSYPHLRDRGRAAGCVPAGYLQERAAPRPAPPPRTETTGTQTGSSPGSYRTSCSYHTATSATRYSVNKQVSFSVAF